MDTPSVGLTQEHGREVLLGLNSCYRSVIKTNVAIVIEVSKAVQFSELLLTQTCTLYRGIIVPHPPQVSVRIS